MNYDYITQHFNAVKPLLEAGADVWVQCKNLGWGKESKVTMRPENWTGVPFPTGPSDDAFEQNWAHNPFISADPCGYNTVVKGKLAYVERTAEERQKMKGTMQEPELGAWLDFKPSSEPKLSAFISFVDYKNIKTQAPAGWTDTLSQEYKDLKQKVDEQKMKGLW